MKSFSLTDTGTLREMNQDYYFSSEHPVGNLPNLYIVADGMGGHKAGDYASRYTTERVVASIALNGGDEPMSVIGAAIQNANDLLIRDAAKNPDRAGMGTTIVVAVICGNKLICANVGDSRLYLIGAGIRQITRDHSLVDEMVRKGEIEKSEARLHPDKNIITRAIGAVPLVEADFFEVQLEPTDRILICTDGLTNMVTDEEICAVIRGEGSLARKGEELVRKANENGGRDNITVVLIEPTIQ